MASIIRKLEISEIPSFVEIAVNAYPGTSQYTADYKERFATMLTTIQENESSIEFFGIFRDGTLVGGMRIHYFEMNLHTHIIEVGGVGLVAVDLLHKKEKVAKELITYFIEHFKNRGTSMVALYPFRPDFYKKMGFGYGTKINYYHIEPASFPSKGTKDGLVFLAETHKEQLKACYDDYAKTTHGMMLKTNRDVELMFKNPDNKLVGFMNGDKLEGYLMFSFKKMSETNFVHNNLLIKEMIYRNPQALSKLSTFLNSQSDQISRIELITQDDSLEFLLGDPRNGTNNLIPSVYHESNVAGVGLMYRVIQIEKFIEQMSNYRFNNATLQVGLTILDSFIEKNSRRVVIDFKEGKATISQETAVDVEMTIDISDLSSLLMGAVTFKKLSQYGRIEVSDSEKIAELNRLFAGMEKPLCLTAF